MECDDLSTKEVVKEAIGEIGVLGVLAIIYEYFDEICLERTTFPLIKAGVRNLYEELQELMPPETGEVRGDSIEQHKTT